MLATIGYATVVFAATNIDDIFVLVGFFADRSYRGHEIVIGQVLGIGVLIAVSVFCSLLALTVPAHYVGLLGVLPIAIGLKRLWDTHGRGEEEMTLLTRRQAKGGSGMMAVAAVTIANGGDNIAVYVPVFATSTSGAVAVMGLVFLTMTALWCAAAHSLVSHRALGAPIRRIGHRVLPFVLIALGVYILQRQRSFELFTWVCAGSLTRSSRTRSRRARRPCW